MKLLWATMVAVWILGMSAAGAQSVEINVRRLPKPQVKLVGDHPVPWPWGFEVPFPTDSVTGLWLVENTEDQFFFAFASDRNNPAGQLVVRQVDSMCHLVSIGVAYAEGKIMRAQMRVTTGQTYSLTLRAFPVTQLPMEMPIKPVSGRYMALTIASEDHAQELTMPLQLVSRQIPASCR